MQAGGGIPLSRREREVAALVAEGLTDREIARRLFISERTAESHVQQIRNKLGLENRTQVASWFTRQTVGTSPAAPSPTPSGTAGATAAPAATAHNLPGQLTRFIGRGRELGEIRRLLQRSRLLTITGPGGCGKTRLAVEAVGEVIHRHPGGAWFVDLSGLTDAASIPQALAAALDVRDRDAGDLLHTVVTELRTARCRQQCLVILDNCEHIIDACALVVTSLLTSCPQLSILCTSREPLHVPGEAVWTLEPLALPSAEARSAEVVGRSEAVQLFVDRAELSDPAFALDDANAAIVLELCRQLDGIPLALELAAARIGVTPVGDLLGQLTSSLRRRGVPSRQQTMRTAIAWSYQLLDEAERRLFRRLAVFRGGFTLEAVREVGAEPGVDDAFALVESLQDKSLLARVPERPERFRLLEPIRHHALELLTGSGELEAVRRAHFAFFTGLAERGDRELGGPAQAEWLRRLADDHDNLRATLEHGRERPNEERLRLVLALARFWQVLGHQGEGRAWFGEVLASPAPASPERARALNAAAGLAWMQGDLERARVQLEASLSSWREVGDEAGIQNCLANLGIIASTQSDWTAGLAYLEEGLLMARRRRDEPATAVLLGNLGVLGAHLGDHEVALERLTEAEHIFHRLGDGARKANAHANLGLLAVHRDRVGEAAAHYGRSLRLHRDLREPQSLAESLEGVAWVAFRSGHEELAFRLGGAASAIRQAFGAPHRPWSRHVVDGWLDEARRILGEAAGTAWSEGEALGVPEAIAAALEECSLAEKG
ncbi:MAG TPA: LuxR C-terminal-related transcriptional regulator [Candidatus Dormibacteraeota bacterium]|nr:LuxR C-terminal-related transcriptional regulator [Candidatus Dormibacteraeota bacterium]